jgi:predicted membrane-bound spermidine synthase
MADSLGAAIGAFATGVILMPALGIPLTFILLTFIKLSSFTLLKAATPK